MEVPNRLVRSATAECMADAEGRPRREFAAMYRTLAGGSVGLIITGHMYVHPGGRTHLGMTGIHNDSLVPELKRLADAVHEEGGRIVAQINHGGMQIQDESVPEPIAPSAIDASFLKRKARAMTLEEINMVVSAFAKAAGRVKEADFDGVQIHAAHGYLISQFLSPFINKRAEVPPLQLADALELMETKGDELLVFTNVASGALSILYRRQDGSYLLVEPDIS